MTVLVKDKCKMSLFLVLLLTLFCKISNAAPSPNEEQQDPGPRSFDNVQEETNKHLPQTNGEQLKHSNPEMFLREPQPLAPIQSQTHPTLITMASTTKEPRIEPSTMQTDEHHQPPIESIHLDKSVHTTTCAPSVESNDHSEQEDIARLKPTVKSPPKVVMTEQKVKETEISVKFGNMACLIKIDMDRQKSSMSCNKDSSMPLQLSFPSSVFPKISLKNDSTTLEFTGPESDQYKSSSSAICMSSLTYVTAFVDFLLFQFLRQVNHLQL